MDTQLTGAVDGDEWAVERILSHHGARTEASFEILWKSGDVTWLPYYQITHLQALTDYLELLGVRKIIKLPKGTGRPPQDDPQVFVGFITTAATPHSSESPLCFPFSRPTPFHLKAAFHSITSHILSFFKTPFLSLTVDLEYLAIMPPGPRPPLRSIDHPRFSRISPTHYLLRNVEGYLNHTIHAGQIADFINFDQSLREPGELSSFRSMPLGYLEFAELWNSGVHQGDPRRFSTIYFPEGAEEPLLTIAPDPVALADFVITPQQVGLATNNSPPSSVASVQSSPQYNSRRFEDRPMREHRTVLTDKRRYVDQKSPYEKYHDRRHWHLNGDPQPEPEEGLSHLVFRARDARRCGRLQYTVPLGAPTNPPLVTKDGQDVKMQDTQPQEPPSFPTAAPPAPPPATEAN